MVATRLFLALICGGLFGFALGMGDMVNPARVLAFLDLAGNWDPTLLYFMGGALIVAVPLFQLTLRKANAPLFDRNFVRPTAGAVDARLVGGSALFGLGWGLVGYCPGPAVSSLVFGNPKTAVFVVAMLAGLYLGSVLTRPRAGRAAVAA